MESKELIDEFAKDILTKEIDSLRIRIHEDYHLGQVLTTKNDYIIIRSGSCGSCRRSLV